MHFRSICRIMVKTGLSFKYNETCLGTCFTSVLLFQLTECNDCQTKMGFLFWVFVSLGCFSFFLFFSFCDQLTFPKYFALQVKWSTLKFSQEAQMIAKHVMNKEPRQPFYSAS